MHVPCRVVGVLAHDLVLGIDWLRQWNPVVDWVASSMTVKVGSVQYAVQTVPSRSTAKVELCSVDGIVKTCR